MKSPACLQNRTLITNHPDRQKASGLTQKFVEMLLAALILCLTIPALADDAFYLLPEPLPDAGPGSIIRAEPMQAGPPSTRQLADAWRLMYLSTDVLGETMAVTGTLLVPRHSAADEVPIIGFAPGTQGPAFRCAPSRMIHQGAFYEQPALNDMLQRGYAVAVTDYQGYHPEPKTTYIVGATMGAALLDLVRAAQQLPNVSLSADAPVVLRGYSQGGAAALWAGQMQPHYAPDLELRGIAAGGVPANLARVALPLDGQEGFGVMWYALSGQDNAYPELSLQPFLNPAGEAALQEMHSSMCVLELLQSFAGMSLADVTDISPLNSERLQRISENQLGRQPIMVPVFQYHEISDALVAFDQAESLRNQYCADGVEHIWRPYDTEGRNGLIRHINLAFHGNAEVNDFIDDRLAGELAQSNCLP